MWGLFQYNISLCLGLFRNTCFIQIERDKNNYSVFNNKSGSIIIG